ncbi:MAG: nuclease-related domain-containing protein [Acholeplasma sp.]|nr:nuclease-related domain-containing protein [Acholeplasma sp.]
MAKRKRKKEAPMVEWLIGLIGISAQMIAYAIYGLLQLIKMIFMAVSVYRSGYKAKSQNGFFKTFFNKGNRGEFMLYQKLIKIVDKKYVLTNLYLSGKNTTKTELDIVCLTHQGIYVFEVKNYGGYIFGSEKDEFWTQAFNRFVKHRFYNPLRQNYAHQKAIASYLNVEDDVILPVVSFSQRSTLSKINVSQDKHVLNIKDTIKLVKSNRNHISDKLCLNDLNYYLALLEKTTKMDKTTKRQHIEEVKTLIDDQDKNLVGNA